MRKSQLKRRPVKRRKIRRDWKDAQRKVTAEGKCRGCGRTAEHLKLMGRTLEAAHTIGRTYDPKSDVPRFDRYVPPAAVIPLCGPPTDTGTCHNAFDGHELNIWPKLNHEEAHWAIARIGEGQARRRIEGRRP